jgi:N-formylglutamate deformylase
VASGRAIYRGKLTRAEAALRIDEYWRPYHTVLAKELRNNHTQFGSAILIDCHSMPHEAIEAITTPQGQRPQIVSGDRFGASAGSDIVDRVEAAFISAGFVTARNAPFAGAYITQAYGRPSRGMHAIQIEIDRSLYMDELMIEPNNNFQAVCGQITAAMADIVEIGQRQVPLAAE